MVEHCNDDDLSIIALGEPASPADEAHLQQCPRCQSRLDQLSAVVSTARQIDDKDSLMTPPPGVWDAIADELDMQPGVTSLSSRRRPRSGWLLAAAAAAVGVAIGSVATIGVTSTGDTSPAVLAEVGLEPIGDQAVSGAARIERVGATTTLSVEVPGLPAVDDGYYEVWMATADAGTMVAVGTLDADGTGSITLPGGMDVTEFPLVDVSIEHFDGDAGHSADSVVRGLLAT